MEHELQTAMELVEKAISRTRLLTQANVNLDFPRTLAYVLDHEAMARIDDMYKKGTVSFELAIHLVGRTARVDWAFSKYSKNQVPKAEFYRMLPYVWATGTDIEDIKPTYVEIWRKAWVANGRKTIVDGKPSNTTGTLIIYRGHRKDHPTKGCNWHMEIGDAELAALGHLKSECPRTVAVGVVDVKDVLAYLTTYKKCAVVDPAKVRYLSASLVKGKSAAILPANSA